MPLSQKQFYTTKDIYNLPDGTRAELIDGQIYYMAPPSRTHQQISGEIFADIKNYLRSKKGQCEAYIAPFAIFLNNDETTYFEPDISVICDTEKLDEKGCHGAPDWIIEVTSPNNSSHDYVLKLNQYLAAGVREYWIVNPKKKAITVYDFSDENFIPQLYTFTDKIKVTIYEDLYIDFKEITRILRS